MKKLFQILTSALCAAGLALGLVAPALAQTDAAPLADDAPPAEVTVTLYTTQVDGKNLRCAQMVSVEGGVLTMNVDNMGTQYRSDNKTSCYYTNNVYVIDLKVGNWPFRTHYTQVNHLFNIPDGVYTLRKK